MKMLIGIFIGFILGIIICYPVAWFCTNWKYLFKKAIEKYGSVKK